MRTASQSHYQQRHSRRGVAPLELVMGLPVLMLVVASTFSIGNAALGKQVAAVEARQYGWMLRSDPQTRTPQLSSQSWLGKKHDPMTTLDAKSDILVAESEQEMRVAGWLGTRVKPKSQTAIVMGTWADSTKTRGTHFSMIPKLARQAGSGITSGLRTLVPSIGDLIRGMAS